ncbi:MAG: ABC transporter permease [Thaumarchaeota archaeon]|nr:ABC transporter permease [Nitrososphaerota archaeon]
MGLRSYVLKKLLIMIPLILGVMAFNFVLIHAAPGGPLTTFDNPRLPAATRLAILHQFGLDQPLYVQFYLYLSNLFHGNLGQSFYQGLPVITIIEQKLPATILLTGTSTIVSILIGVPLGVLAATKPHSIADRLVSGISIFGYSIPVFWLGIMLLEVFSVYFRWLPSSGIHSLNAPTDFFGSTLDLMEHMVLPVTTLTIVSLAPFALFTRAGMIEALRKDYILTAKAKGAGHTRILFRHALHNGILSVFTVIGLSLAFVVAGAVLVETVFSWPGIGLLLYQTILQRDYPVLLGTFLIIAMSVFVINLITDIVYAFLDPRITLD